MSKKIIVLSNGTGNSAGDVCKTNVWRLYQALDLSASDQMACYNDGVGTSSFKPLAILGGVTGWGLKRNVLDLYMFICRNYDASYDKNGNLDAQNSDQIYGFGFSRGAFTIRVLMGLIDTQGLVRFSSQEELKLRAAAAYRAYRKSYQRRSPVVIISRAIRDGFIALRDKFMGYETYNPSNPHHSFRNPSVRFLGLWDTVDAYGIPVREMKIGIDRYIWPMTWSNNALSPLVQRACHALALDDERLTFHPLPWDELAERRAVENGEVASGRLSQVWFAGMHANIGGGYPEDSLAHIALSWMADEAMQAGLRFSASGMDLVRSNATPYGALANSRAGLSAYYRYRPRDILLPNEQGDTQLIEPVIHESILQRMALGGDYYVPLPLEDNFKVLTQQTGPQLPTTNLLHAVPNTYTTMSFNQYKANLIAAQPHFPIQNQIKAMSLPHPDVKEVVKDIIWWRQFSYSFTLLITLILVAFPLLVSFGLFSTPPETVTTLSGPPISALSGAASEGTDFALSDLFSDAIRFDHERIKDATDALTNPLLDVASAFTPSYFSPWIEAFRGKSWLLIMLLAALVSTFSYSNFLERRIRDKGRLAWNLKMNNLTVKALRIPSQFKFIIYTVLMGGLVGMALILWMMPLPKENAEMSNFISRWRIILAGAAAVAFWAWWTWTLNAHERRLKAGLGVKTGVFLRIARWARTNEGMLHLKYTMSRHALPFIYAGIVVAVGALAFNRLGFTLLVSMGEVCLNPAAHHVKLPINTPVTFLIKASDPCAGTGLKFEKGATYQLTIPKTTELLDGTIGTKHEIKSAGFSWRHPDAGLRMLFAIPLRRVMGENWFVPLAQVGDKGGHIYPLGANSTRITPDEDGALSLYVNDAVLGLPYMWPRFYENNRGNFEIVITKIETPERY